MDLVKASGIVSPEDIIMLEDTNPDTIYDCSEYTKCAGFTLLHKLVLLVHKYPDLNNVIKDYIIREPNEVNKVNEKGWSALSLVVRNSNKLGSVLNILLDNGANILHQDNYGWTALMHAVRYSGIDSSIETIKLLLAKPIFDLAKPIFDLAKPVLNNNVHRYVNMQTIDGKTCLMLAIYSFVKNGAHSLNVIKLLLNYTSNPSDSSYQQAYTSNPSDSSYQQAYTSNPSDSSYQQAYTSNPSDSSYQQAYGADTNIKNINGLHTLLYAVKYVSAENLLEVLKILLEYDASVNMQDNRGYTTLMRIITRFKGSIALNVVKLLLDFGANINLQTNKGRTVLHILSEQVNPDIEIVKMLLENIFSANTFSANTFRANTFSANTVSANTVSANTFSANTFSANTVSANIKSDVGHVACIIAVNCNNIDIVELLLKFHDINMQCNGFTFFMVAAQGKHINIAKLLLKNGADINMQNNDGLTALHLASYNYSEKMIDFLLSIGIKTNIRANNGDTALHIIMETKPDKFDIMKKYVDNGADVHIENDFGDTPLDICSTRVRDMVLEYIGKN